MVSRLVTSLKLLTQFFTIWGGGFMGVIDEKKKLVEELAVRDFLYFETEALKYSP
jgi:hypothetical protein